MTLILSVDTLPNTSTDFPGYPLSLSFPYLPRSAPVPNHFPVAPRGSARYNCVYFVPRNSLQSLLNPVQSWPPLGSQRRLVDVYRRDSGWSFGPSGMSWSFGPGEDGNSAWVQTSFEPEHTHVQTRRRTRAKTEAWT
ncbi:MAG: hypothetical protein ACO20I_13125 [bacterium]